MNYAVCGVNIYSQTSWTGRSRWNATASCRDSAMHTGDGISSTRDSASTISSVVIRRPRLDQPPLWDRYRMVPAARTVVLRLAHCVALSRGCNEHSEYKLTLCMRIMHTS